MSSTVIPSSRDSPSSMGATRLPMLLDSAAKILNQENQMQRVGRRAFKPELHIPLSGALVERMNEQCADPDQLASPQDTHHRIQQ